MEVVSQKVSSLVGMNVLTEISKFLAKIHSQARTPLVRSAPEELADKLAIPVEYESTTKLLLQFRAGDEIPVHIEKYQERIVCLSGEYENSCGKKFLVGDVEEVSPGDRHGVTALKDDTTLFVQWVPALDLEDISKLKRILP